jgi:nucleoside-diphosphate-sugar epimerase
MQTILGANGTIGSILARELHSYTSAIRLVSRNPRKVNDSDELFPADLTQANQVDQAISGSSIVYLLVGFEYNIKVWQKQWPLLMQRTIDSCIQHKAKLVFFDNVYMYDRAFLEHMTEETPIKPSSKKGEVRAQLVNMIQNAMQTQGLQAMIVRAADFYGPGNETSMLIEMALKNIAKGKNGQWLGNKHVVHSFTYTPDAAKATALLGNTETAYQQVWHLPTSHEKLSVQQLVEICGTFLNRKISVSLIPTWLIKLLGIFIPVMKEMPEMIYQFDRPYFFDSSKFEKEFGISATSYQVGLQKTLNALKLK